MRGTLHAIRCTNDPCICEPMRVRIQPERTFALCDNGGAFRDRGISTPGAQSHTMTRPSAGPADPRTGRGLVVRGSGE